jgi:hypothetical protein
LSLLFLPPRRFLLIIMGHTAMAESCHHLVQRGGQLQRCTSELDMKKQRPQERCFVSWI